MIEYLIERYETLHKIFLIGWGVWLVSAVLTACFVSQICAADPHRGSKRYYAILIFAATFIIGLIGTILLPSPELFARLIQ